MLPRVISHKGTLQALEAFQPIISLVGSHNCELEATRVADRVEHEVIGRLSGTKRIGDLAIYAVQFFSW